MYHYLFTNDLRISHLEESLIEAGRCFETNTVPSAKEDKNANNNINTLGFYFNLTQNSICTHECTSKNVRKVVLNFVKKFQFPNPRTKESYEQTSDDGIQIAPMRVILKLLYVMNMQTRKVAYLTKQEIADFIFFNSSVAKTKNIDFMNLIRDIEVFRTTGNLPDTIETNPDKRLWTQEIRQVREMVKVLNWSGCVKEEKSGNIYLKSDGLTLQNKADLFDILTYENFWEPEGDSFDEIKKSYQVYMDVAADDNEGEIEDMKNNSVKFLNFNTNILIGIERNRILFGAPGTGKSYTLNKQVKELLKNGGSYERVTFHPDYSYANFVGTYKPIMVSEEVSTILDSVDQEVIAVLSDNTKTAQEKYDLLYDKFNNDGSLTRLPLLLGLYSDGDFKSKKADGSDASGANIVERNHGKAIRQYVSLKNVNKLKEEIAYEYVPGAFMRVLVKALKSAMTDLPKPYLLVIEEINRANVAAVFGDVFQLLDRDMENVSEYAITATKDMCSYLSKGLGIDISEVETIKIPDNMFIWATMNSADQGVFPMDTAFKRRWDFTYLGIDDAVEEMENSIKNRKFTFGTGSNARILTWNEIRVAINEELSSENYNINEDKLLGPYFVSKSVLSSTEENFLKVFKNKVLMYLFDDVVKQKKNTFFEAIRKESKGIRYSEICKAFDEKGVYIFPDSISSRFNEKPISAKMEEIE